MLRNKLCYPKISSDFYWAVDQVSIILLKAIKALESALESIGQDLQTFYEENNTVTEATPEDLLKVNRTITEATGKAVAASLSKNQEDVVAVANLGRKVVGDLIRTIKV